MNGTKSILRAACVISLLLRAQLVCAWWNIECIDKTYGEDVIVISSKSLAAGDNGSIHAVYSLDGEIVHAYHDKWIWNKEVVATTESLNNYPSLVV